MSDKDNGNGNGHKIFRLAEMEPDLNSLAPQYRYKVCSTHKLTTGARMLYCHLSDQSFLRSVNQGTNGTVTKSKDKLGYELGVNERTIRRWGRELEALRFVWTRVYWHAGFELTTWYLRGLADEQQEFWKDADPRYGRSRTAKNQHRPTVRGVNGQFCPNTQDGSQSTDLPEKSGVNGQPCPPTTDSRVRGQRTAVSGDNGQPCPVTADSRVRGQRTILSVVRGQSCPLTADNPVRSQGTPVSGLKETPDVKGEIGGDSFKRSTGFNALKSAGGAKKLNPENLFLMDVGAEMENWRKGSSKAELANSGGWWRMAFRADPSLMRSVLNEIRCMIREGKIKTNPGATAVDLWKRWDGEKSLSNPKLKRAAVKAAA